MQALKLQCLAWSRFAATESGTYGVESSFEESTKGERVTVMKVVTWTSTNEVAKTVKEPSNVSIRAAKQKRNLDFMTGALKGEGREMLVAEDHQGVSDQGLRWAVGFKVLWDGRCENECEQSSSGRRMPWSDQGCGM
jgi:hypothetical protein